MKARRWLVPALVALWAAGFTWLNRDERTLVNVGFATFYRVPLTVVLFIAFLAGMLSMLALSLRQDRRMRDELRARGLLDGPGKTASSVDPLAPAGALRPADAADVASMDAARPVDSWLFVDPAPALDPTLVAAAEPDVVDPEPATAALDEDREIASSADPLPSSAASRVADDPWHRLDHDHPQPAIADAAVEDETVIRPAEDDRTEILPPHRHPSAD